MPIEYTVAIEVEDNQAHFTAREFQLALRTVNGPPEEDLVSFAVPL
jgi:hypothetical protein